MAETELNSVTDNPIVISDEEAISGGNFHGQLMASSGLCHFSSSRIRKYFR
jgi:histidine ammonia-lyase